MRWADERADVALGTRPSAGNANRPGSGRGQGRQSPKAGARSASLGPGRSLVYFNTVAPRRSGFLVTVACASSRRLDAGVEASGPHDFAVRVSTVRLRAARVHRIPPRVDDVAQRPSVGQDGEEYRSDLGFGKTEIFLQKGLDSKSAR